MALAHWLSRRIASDGLAYRVLSRVYRAWQSIRFRSSTEYWERRYASGGNSGEGSYGESARFKATFLNEFFSTYAVTDVVELGHGDGAQAGMLDVTRYRGFDVSPTAVARCRERFAGDSRRSFETMDTFGSTRGDTALSLDVLFHLVEDAVFERYMHQLFDCAERFVVVYSTDCELSSEVQSPHVRHRAFTAWVDVHRPDFRRLAHTPSAVAQLSGEADRKLGFYVFERLPMVSGATP